MAAVVQITAEPNTHEMVVVHKIFRHGFPMAAKLMREVPEEHTGRAAVLAKHVDYMLRGLLYHHTTEDDYLWPRLLDRAALSADLIARMEDQHRVVHDLIERAQELLAVWRTNPSGPALADTLDELDAALTEHVDEEEALVLPLVREHITVAEWNEMGEKSFAKFSIHDKFIALGELLEVATRDEAAMFLEKLPSPVRLIWRFVGQPYYSAYVAGIRGAASAKAFSLVD